MSTKPTLRRGLLIGSTTLVATALLAAGSARQPAAQEMLELRLAVTDPALNPVTDSALKLALSEGYYEAHGLRVELVPLEGTPQAVAALNAGEVDVADISIDSMLRLRAENDVAIRGIVSATLGPPYLIAAQDSIATPADLVGRTYAIADNGSLDHTLTQHVLDALGVGRDSPEFVAIGAPGVRVRALAAGQVDATTVSYGTFLPIADTPGLHIIVQPEDFFAAAPIQSKLVATLETTIAEKPEALQRFVAALIDIARDYDTDAGPWVDAVATERTDLTRENLEATTAFLDGRWCVNGCVNLDHIQETVDFIYASADFEGVPVVTAADITDESFALKAIEELGEYEGGGIDAR